MLLEEERNIFWRKRLIFLRERGKHFWREQERLRRKREERHFEKGGKEHYSGREVVFLEMGGNTLREGRKRLEEKKRKEVIFL